MKKLNVMFLSIICLNLFSLFGAEQIVVPLEGLTEDEIQTIRKALVDAFQEIERERTENAIELSKKPDVPLIIAALKSASDDEEFQRLLKENRQSLSGRDVRPLWNDPVTRPSFKEIIYENFWSGSAPTPSEPEDCVYTPIKDFEKIRKEQFETALALVKQIDPKNRIKAITHLIKNVTLIDPSYGNYSFNGKNNNSNVLQRKFVINFGNLLNNDQLHRLKTLIAFNGKFQIHKKEFFLECWEQFLKVRIGEIHEMPSCEQIMKLIKISKNQPTERRKIAAAAANYADDGDGDAQ